MGTRKDQPDKEAAKQSGWCFPQGNIIGEHEVKFSSGKEIVTLNHESFDRALYSEGALIASKWLMRKKPGLYSMRDLLNFK